MAQFEVRFTGERHTEESDTHGDAAERGWVDPSWSMRVLFEDRGGVEVKTFDTLDEAVEYIEETIGSVDQNDAPFNYYANDSRMDLESGDSWRYAGHITEVE